MTFGYIGDVHWANPEYGLTTAWTVCKNSPPEGVYAYTDLLI